MKQAVKSGLGLLAAAAFGAWGLRRRMEGPRRAPDLASARSILLVRVNLLGDLLFTLPAVAAIRAAAPRARMTMAVLPYTASLLAGTGLVDRVLPLDLNGWRRPSAWLTGRAWREMRTALLELRAESYDLCVSFYGAPASAIALASGARFTVGYAAEGFPFAFDLALSGRRYDARRHEAEYCLDLVRMLDAGGEAVVPALPADPIAERDVDAMLAGADVRASEKIVALHPGALNMAAKRWLPARWAAVGDRIQTELGARVVLVGSPSEVPLAETVRRYMLTRPISLAGRTSIPQLAALLRRADLFLGGDSGPLHLASAMGVPSVSVYGPTDPANTGPRGPRAAVLRGSADCIPCYDLKRAPTCWRGDLRCMSQVGVDDVFEAARGLIEGRAERGHRSSVVSRQSSVREGREGQEGKEGSGDHLSTTPRHLSPSTQHPAPSTQDPSPIPHPPALGTRHSAPSTRHPAPSTNLRRILVVKLAGIGDLLTAFPALEALRDRYPLAEVTALVTPQSGGILAGSGLVDRTVVFDKYAYDTAGGFAQAGSLARLVDLGRRLRGDSYDAMLLLHHLITRAGVAKYAALALAIGAPIRAGLDDGRGRFLTLSAPDKGFGARHEVEYALDVVRLLGAENSRPRVRLTWGDQEEAFGAAWLAEAGIRPGEPVLAVHPGAGSYSPVRRWAPERFAEVASDLARDGLAPVIVAGPGEEALAQRVAAGIPGCHFLLRGTPTPRHLAAVLARCALFVGNDSGVTHVASAAGIPVVAVFGPSNHKAWAPYDPDGTRTRVVRSDLPCSPCLYRGRSLGLRNGCGDPRCLETVEPGAVARAARDLLGRRPETC